MFVLEGARHVFLQATVLRFDISSIVEYCTQLPIGLLTRGETGIYLPTKRLGRRE